ncbi:MAG: AIR synthase-related protein, partial [Candidatus Woesearchaeota archaeon]|nr:AIR synthase-related protein [Candidatus Woesearchaeota archaeon]
IAKCLVYCGTIGWSPVRSADGRTYISKAPHVDDFVFVAGQPVGVDGVHGATESSLKASEKISLGHVQADHSYTQAKMKGLILECARKLMFTSVTDFGAMGLGSSAIETAGETNGIEMDLSLHPRKYAGIQPWQINCSETQDRMLFVADPKNEEEIIESAKLHEVQVTKLGRLTDTGYANLKYEGNTVALLDLKRLFNKEPRKQMHASWGCVPDQREAIVKGNYSLEETLSLVMSQPDVASKEWFFRQKDSSVKGATIQGPLIGMKQEVEADATMQKPLDTEGKDFGVIAYALGITPKGSDIDPYHSAQRSFIDMAGKIIALGGKLPDMVNPKYDAWAVCGNFCQPDSERNTTLLRENGEHNLASLVREGIGIRDAVEQTNIPIISGKDSMKCSCTYEVDASFNLNDVPLDLRKHITLVEDAKSGKRHIEIHDPDSYLASCAVKIDDYRKCVSSPFKESGDLIYIIGTTRNHMGASQYLSAIGYKEQGLPLEGGEVPKADLKEFVSAANAIGILVDAEVVASCSYIHNGGLLPAVTKAAMAGGFGAMLSVNNVCKDGAFSNDEQILFSETPGRFIVTVSREDSKKFEEIMGKADVTYGQIGTVTGLSTGSLGDNLEVCSSNGINSEISLRNVKEHYQRPLSFGMRTN